MGDGVNALGWAIKFKFDLESHYRFVLYAICLKTPAYMQYTCFIPSAQLLLKLLLPEASAFQPKLSSFGTFHTKTPYCLLHTESCRSGFLRFHRETGPEEEADAAAAFLSFRRSCTFNWPDWRVKTVDSTVTMGITEGDGRQLDLTAAAATSAAAKTLSEAGIFLSFAMFFPVATGGTAA